jgi:hypothetical protein
MSLQKSHVGLVFGVSCTIAFWEPPEVAFRYFDFHLCLRRSAMQD